MLTFAKNKRKEQECIINIDNYTKEFCIYTSKKSTYNKIKNIAKEYKLKEYITKGEISGAELRVPFSDRKTIRKILSLKVLLGNQK